MIDYLSKNVYRATVGLYLFYIQARFNGPLRHPEVRIVSIKNFHSRLLATGATVTQSTVY